MKRRKSVRCESLETRRLLSGATVTPVGSVLEIVGTTANDTVNLSTLGVNGTATVDGTPTSFSLNTITSITIDGGGGSDSITIGSGVPLVTQITNNGATIAQATANTLAITGTAFTDIAILTESSGTLTASIDGITESLPSAGINSIALVGGGGADSVSVGSGIPAVNFTDNGVTLAQVSSNTVNTLLITGASGTDSLNLSATGGTLTAAIAGATESIPTSSVTGITFNSGGAASASLTSGTAVPSVTLIGSNIAIQGSGIFNTGSTISLIGTSGNDTVNLFVAGANLTAAMGTVSETVLLSSVNAIKYNGNGGNDSISVGANVPLITTTNNGGTVTQLNANTLTLAGTHGFDTVSLSASSGTLTANLDGVTESFASSPITAITFHGHGGPDSLSVGAGVPAVTIDEQGSSITPNGTTLTVTGTAAANTVNFSVTSGTLSTTLAGVTETIPSTAVTGISYLSGGAADNLTIGTGVPVVTLTTFNATVNGVNINTSSGAISITGSAGNDTLSLTSLTGLIISTGGATQTIPLAGITSISADMGAGNDSVNVGPGVPSVNIRGNLGNDTIIATNSANVTIRGGIGDDSVNAVGSTGNNLLVGGGGHDSLTAGSGNTTLRGGAKSDSLIGGAGNDFLFGGQGYDHLVAGSGNSVLRGGIGNDFLIGGSGADLLIGNSGSNTIQPESPLTTIQGATANDTVLSATAVTSQSVSAMANIYGAGYTTAPNGNTTGTSTGTSTSTNTSTNTSGILPTSTSFPAVAGLVLTFSSVTGSISLNGGVNHNDPDGNGAQISTSADNGFQSLGGIIAPGAGYLVGVFETSATPTGAPPPTLNYTNGLSTSATDYSPQLNQVFFIGDGLTGDGSGTAQKFHVPAGATRIFIGISDAPNYGTSVNGDSGIPVPGGYTDNVGTYTVSFTVAVPFVST